MPTVNADPTPGDSVAGGPLTAATDRFIATASALDGSTLSAPSLCARWTRAHVLTHVARNADSLTNLLTWARTGVMTPMHSGREARDAAIEAGTRRHLDEIVEDLRTSAGRFSRAIMEMPEEGWERQVRLGGNGTGEPIPGRRVLWLRLRELEFHHVDLDAGYGTGNWPDAFVRRALDEVVRSFGRRDDIPPITLDVEGRPKEHIGSPAPVTVSGSPANVLGWLTGRSAGGKLRIHPAGPLPVLPAWF